MLRLGLDSCLKVLVAAFIDRYLAGIVRQKAQMDEDVAEGCTDIVPADFVADLRLWHILRERDEAIGDHNNGALVENLHFVCK